MRTVIGSFGLLISSLLMTSSLTAQILYLETYPAGCGNATGQAYIEVIMAVPYTIVWSPEPGSGQGTHSPSGMAPGEYTVTVTNDVGVTASETFTIEAIPGLYSYEAIVTSYATCEIDYNGLLFFGQGYNGPFGQAPYSLTGSPDLSFTPVDDFIHISGICEGPGYAILVTDALGCTDTFTIGPVALIIAPVLLSSSTTESCPDGASGSIQLLFDQPTWLTVDGDLYAEPATLHDLQDLAPGEYIFEALTQDYNSCWNPVEISITVDEATTGCGTITGTLYADLDGDCIQQPGEPGIPYRTLAFSPAPEEVIITDAVGHYIRGRLLGEHTLEASVPGFAPLCPPSAVVPFELLTDGQVIEQDLAWEPNMGPDAYVQQVSPGSAPGFDLPHWVSVHNDGPYTLDPMELQFNFSPLQTVVSSNIAPLASNPGFLSWNVPQMQPFSSWQVQVFLQLVPDPLLIGDTIVFEATLFPPVPDADPANDVHILEMEITGAYDPNDKIAYTSSGASSEYYFPVSDEYIDYRIRFQNTGNAPAHNVFVIDTIPPQLDLLSLQIHGASHPFEVQWLEERALRFDLPNIMLADSVNNEPESHGYISFRLKPLPSIMIGDVIANWADIFFDFNPPIRTNTTELMVSEPVGIADAPTLPQLRLYPNPATDQIRVSGEDLHGASWRVLGIDGRGLLQGTVTTAEPVILVAALARGTYLLQVTKFGGEVVSGRFVRE